MERVISRKEKSRNHMTDNKSRIQNGRMKMLVFWGLMFAGAFLVLSQMGYSDGDDAFFYQHAHSMGFIEYLAWRYENWVGRIAAEALVYINFRQGLWFWRTVNALMLVLLPIGLIRLACSTARVPEWDIRNWHRMQPACSDLSGENSLGLASTAVAGYFLMSIMTLGYAAIWVNGSIFYTWSFTCGIWALIPFAESVFGMDERAGSESRSAKRNPMNRRMFLYSIPCSVVASMSIEQMGAVLLVFEVLGFFICYIKYKKMNVLLLVQLCITILAFGFLFAATGNEIRVAEEITNWMPQYETISFGEHLFITVQWLISSFANENKLFLCGIWVSGIFLFFQKKVRRTLDTILAVTAGVLTLIALLPYVGMTVFSNIGMNLSDITVCITQVPRAEEMTPANWMAFIWWGTALIFTLVYLARVSGFQVTLMLAYLAGIASEAIMFFSPTMYASGGRVYYLTDLLYLFIILCLSLGIKGKRQRNCFYAVLIVAGMINFIVQIPILLESLA